MEMGQTVVLNTAVAQSKNPTQWLAMNLGVQAERRILSWAYG
jgi:thiazole synthase ThiGH ThiG subunit